MSSRAVNFAISALALGLSAISLGNRPPFTEQPGVREFTGELIVRPVQIDAQLDAGLTYERIRGDQAAARQRIRRHVIRYTKSVDEYVVRVPRGSNENRFAYELLRTGQYQYVVPNWRLYPVGTPNDALFGDQWHLPTIQAPLAWDLVTGDRSIITAFVDTGIKRDHPDLRDLRVPGYNSVERKTEAAGGEVEDVNGHGTHVSGCGSAHGNNRIGVSGVGWNFGIMHVRTSNSPGGGASLDDILAGARWAAENGAKTVSASYSGVDAAPVGTTGTYIKSLGSLFFYAAGNDARDLNGFSHPDTIVVGASNEADTRAGFSAYGRGVHLFAPGQSILSTTIDGGYGRSSGTSMSTPVANGAFAMIWAANPELSAEEVQQMAYQTCDQIGSPSIFGYGRVNVFKAVTEAVASSAVSVAIDAVAINAGTHVRGDQGSVNDTDFVNALVINGTRVSGLGTVAASRLVSQMPTNRLVTSIKVTARVRTSNARPTSVLAFVQNQQTGQFELMTTKGTVGGIQRDLSFRLTNPASYIGPSGNVNMILRSVVPARLGGGANTFEIGHVGVRITSKAIP